MNEDPFEVDASTDDELLKSSPVFPKSKTKNGKNEAAEFTLRKKFQDILDSARFELKVDAYRGIFTSWDKDSENLQHYAVCFRRLDMASPSSARYLGFHCPSIQAWMDNEELQATKKASSGKKNKNKQSNHVTASCTGVSDCDCNPLCFMSLGGTINDCLMEHIKSKNKPSSDVEMTENTTIDLVSHDSGMENPSFELPCLLQTPTSHARDKEDPSSTLRSLFNQPSSFSMEVPESSMQEPHAKKQKIDSIETAVETKDLPFPKHGEEVATEDMVVQNTDSPLQNIDNFDVESSKHVIKNNHIMEGKYVYTPQFSITSDSNMQISSGTQSRVTPYCSLDQDDVVPFQVTVHAQKIVSPSMYPRKTLTSMKKDLQERPQLRTSTCLKRHDIEKYYQSISIDKSSCQLDIPQIIDEIHKWNTALLGYYPPSNTLNDISYCMPPGLTNLGATCYLNSLFQCLAFNLPIMDGILSWTPHVSDTFVNDDNEGCKARRETIHFLSQLQLLLAQMTLGPQSNLDTVNLISALGLSTDEMQDPHEFSKLLFDLIHRSFKETTLEASRLSESLTKLLPSIFSGVSVFKTTCMKCRKSSHRNQDFQDLSLPIITQESPTARSCKKRGVTNSKKKVDATGSSVANPTVQDCLDRYLQSETVSEYFCETCNAQRDIERCMLFEALPPVLNIHLLRYGYDLKTFTRKKLMDKILLSKIIDVPIHKPVKGEWVKCGEKSYTLCAVQQHKGTSAHGGHYIAEVMDWPTGTWMQFNDNEVEILQLGSSYTYDSHSDRNDKEGSSDAYSLFYVDQSFLAGQVSEWIKRIMDGYYKENSCGIVRQMMDARIEFQRLGSEMLMQAQMLDDRLAQRKQWIRQYFLPQLDEDTMNHKKDDILFWVHGDILRRLISCDDGLEDVLSSPCLLNNKPFLCDHDIGLHPRTVRDGKMIAKRSYDNLIQRLKHERQSCLPCQTNDSSMDFKDTDLEITNKSNLFCEQCVDSFRSDLHTRVEFFDAAYQLYQTFDDDYDSYIDRPDISDDGCRYVVSKQFVSSFQRIMKQRMKDVVNNDHRGIDRLDMDFSTFEASFRKEAIDLRVNTSITCPFGNCHSSTNKKQVRHISCEAWANLVTLFPSAIGHMVNVRDLTENQVSELCERCLKDQEMKTDLSANILTWANRVACDENLSKILSQSANPLAKIQSWEVQSIEKLRYFIVHKVDVDEWRAVVNHICGTFSSMKGKDVAKGRKMKAHIEDRLFKVYDNQMSNNKTNELLQNDFKFHSLLCRNHGSLIGHLSPINEIISYMPERSTFPISEDSSLDSISKVELLDSEQYLAYLTSLKELAEVLVLSIPVKTQLDRYSLEGLLRYGYHPNITIFNDPTTEDTKMFQDGDESDILSMIASGCKFCFEPSVCTDCCCWDEWAKDMVVEASENNTESKESAIVDEVMKESSSSSSCISFEVYEIFDDIDLATYGASIIQERNPPEMDLLAARNTRRSNRNRKKCTYTVSAEKEANVAKLKLLVSERTKIDHISDISFYLYIDSLLNLDDKENEKILSHIVGDDGSTYDPILLLQIQSNNGQLKKIDRQEQDEAIMAQLMSLVGESKSDPVTSKERGFQGTMLHSTLPKVKQKSIVHENPVEVID